jgi:hypothetical protein
MQQIPFLCLANSRRDGGHCVAGLNLETFQWVRPVGRIGGPLDDHEVTVEGTGNQLRPFDTVLLTVGDMVPEVGQPENVPLISGISPFQRLPKRMEPTSPINLGAALHQESSLFGLQGDKNDHVARSYLVRHSLASSLALLLIDNPEVMAKPKDGWRMKFRYESQVHLLSVTDLLFQERERQNGKWLICVSLGAAFRGNHYGLVAMAIPIDEIPMHITFNKTKVKVPDVKSETAVYQALKEWRLHKTHETKRPAYTFFNDVTLKELALSRPTTLQDLIGVFGMGPIRVENFGRDILEVIRQALCD